MSQPPPVKTADTAAQVCILMAVRNGQPYLPAQIDSITAQHHSAWRLLVSDDGSSDGSCQLAQSLARSQPDKIRLIAGPQTGYGDNFRTLILNADQADYYALADQDDIWLPQRLTRALSQLQRHGDAPAIALARRDLVDQNLTNQRSEPPMHRQLNFRNALFDSVTPGNAMLMNAAAFAILRKAMSRVQNLDSHDWFTYQIGTGAGFTFLQDDQPTILYRQHGGNAVGAKAGLHHMMWRAWQLSKGGYLTALAKAWHNLDQNRDLLTPDNRALLDAAIALPVTPRWARRRAFRHSGFHRMRAFDHLLLEYALITRLKPVQPINHHTSHNR